jgi:hypothetical protein
VGAGVIGRAVPDPDHALPGAPGRVLGEAEPDHRPALAADEVLGGDADGPAEPGRLGHDLVQGVHRLRPADLRDRLHRLSLLE